MWRGLKESERTVVRRSLDSWGAFLIAERFKILVKASGKDIEVFLVTPQTFHFAILHQPHAAGIHLGTLRRRGLRLGLQGAVMVARESDIRVVRVNEKSEALFLYGRDIFGESVLESKPGLKQNEICIVGNERGEALGLGKLLVPGHRLTEPRFVVENVSDLGRYLRDENNI
jgi:60S ribosome subunit biogenesis protein NIP7